MPIVFEQLLDAPSNAVWDAVTNKEKMKHWYFDLEKFDAVPGFNFLFHGGPENGTQYLHLCEVTRVVPFKTLVYSWRYEGYAGISYVHFEMEERGANIASLNAHRPGIISARKHRFCGGEFCSRLGGDHRQRLAKIFE